MEMIRRRIFLSMICGLCALLCLYGCATSSHVITGKMRQPISPGDVKIYLKPPAKFEEIALIDASSKSSWAFSEQGKMDKAIARLKEEAAKLGANDILLRGAGDQYGGTVSTGSATATAYGNTAYGVGTGVGVPVIHKAASGIAIYVSEE